MLSAPFTVKVGANAVPLSDVAATVSYEFMVPLCAIHHTENHTTGDERGWWQERKIDPLSIAEELWRKSRAQLSIGGEA